MAFVFLDKGELYFTLEMMLKLMIFLGAVVAKLFDQICNWMNLSSSRLQRLRQRAQQQSTETVPPSVTEVNPEFLAALPPAIQEEVLAQQRLEQQRQAAAAANPNDPVDAVAFFQNLQPSLRQAVCKHILKYLN